MSERRISLLQYERYNANFRVNISYTVQSNPSEKSFQLDGNRNEARNIIQSILRICERTLEFRDSLVTTT